MAWLDNPKLLHGSHRPDRLQGGHSPGAQRYGEACLLTWVLGNCVLPGRPAEASLLTWASDPEISLQATPRGEGPHGCLRAAPAFPADRQGGLSAHCLSTKSSWGLPRMTGRSDGPGPGRGPGNRQAGKGKASAALLKNMGPWGTHEASPLQHFHRKDHLSGDSLDSHLAPHHPSSPHLATLRQTPRCPGRFLGRFLWRDSFSA